MSRVTPSLAMRSIENMKKLPRCANPEIDDYPPWLLGATRTALRQIYSGSDLKDARAVLAAIDKAMEKVTA